MGKNENPMKEVNETSVEDVVEAEIIPETPEQMEAAAESEPSFSDEPVKIELSEEPEPEAPAPEEEKPAPGYGAPQMLYEDFIPFEYLHGTEQKEEKPAEEPKPKKEKPKKPAKPTKEEELLAAVEAEMASREEEGATVAPPEDIPAIAEQMAAPEEAVVIADPAIAPVAPVVPVKEEPVMAEKKETEIKEKREYSSFERKLRRKYRLDKDLLLSNNDIVPGFILAKGENVVRCYNCLSSKKGEGTVCLTNKRLMINADERSEVAVNMVTGIKFAKNTYFSVAKFLFGLLFLLLGAAMILLPFFRDKVPVIPYVTDDHWKNWFMYLFIACGAVSVLISFPLLGTMVKKMFYFTVFVNEGAPFLECKSKSFVKNEKKGKQYSFVVTDPGKESEKAARELGALILEVKEGRYDF